MKLTMILLFSILLSGHLFAADTKLTPEEKIKAEEKIAEMNKKSTILVDSIIADLEKKGTLNAKNFAAAFKEKLKAAKADGKQELETLAKIEKLDSSINKDKLKSEIANILSMKPKSPLANEKVACLKEEAACIESKDCCDGNICTTYLKDEEVKVDPTQNQSMFAEAKKPGTVDRRCLKPVEKGSECTPYKSACKDSVCSLYSFNSTTLPICISKDNKCKKNEECCTGKCDNGICAHAYRCQNCKGPGQKPKGKEVCCDGYYLDEEGKCITNYPPSPPVTNNSKKKTFWEKLSNLIISNAEAQTPSPTVTPSPYANIETCQFNSKGAYFNQMYTDKNASPLSGYANRGDMNKAAYMAARAFEFVSLGAGVEDYWKQNGQNIHTRTKNLATSIKNARVANETSFKALDNYMYCNCLAFKYGQLTQEQKDYFTTGQKCAEQAAVVAILFPAATQGNLANVGSENIIDQDGLGASGLKYKEMMMEYFAKKMALVAIKAQTTVVNVSDLDNISTFLGAQDWNGFEETTETNFTRKYKNWVQIVADTLVSLVNDFINWLYGPLINFLNSLWSHPVCSGVASSVHSDFPDPNPSCSTDDYATGSCCAGYCTCGKNYDTTCVKRKYTGNKVCGSNNRNAFCMKTAYKRTDHGKAGDNVYLIDPQAPIGYTSLNLNMGIATVLDFNDKNKMCNFNPPNFTDAHYNSFKQLAIQYAIDNDFYQTPAEQAAWADYVFEEHFMKPRLSRPREMNYDLPGLIPYFSDLTHKFYQIMAQEAASNIEDGNQFINWATDYNNTLTKMTNSKNSKIVTKKIDLVKKSIELAQIHIANLQSQSFANIKPLPSGMIGTGLSSGDLSAMYTGASNLARYNDKQKKKYEHWMKTVGNTPTGQALLAAKQAVEANQVAGIGGNGLGFISNDTKNNLANIKATVPSAKKEEESKSFEVDENKSYYGDNNSKGKKSNFGIDNEIHDKKELDHVLSEAKSNMYDSHVGDSLWMIVSKAYVRGAFPHLLQVKSDLETTPAKPSGLTEGASHEDEKVFAPTKSKKRKIKDELKSMEVVK